MSTTITRQRIHWIDSLKAFAILLVVLGHCVQGSDPDFAHNAVFRFIYAFHMPLFMAVSGYLSYKAVMTLDVVKKRFVQLMLPFLCWPIIWCVVKWDFVSIPQTYVTLFTKPDSVGLWFLYTLFMITVVEFVRIKLVTIYKSDNRGGHLHDLLDYGSILAIAGILNLVLLKTNCKLFGFNFIAWYYIFYSLGSVMRKNNEWLMQHIRPIGVAALICYIVGASFWNIQEPPTFYQWINLGSVFVYVYKLLVAVAGILASFYIFSQFVNRTSGKLVGYIAGLTLGIYAVHQTIVRYTLILLPSFDLMILVPTVFIIVFLVSLGIIRLLQLNKWTSLLLLGVKKTS